MPLLPFLALNEGSRCAYHAGRLDIQSPLPTLPLFTVGQLTIPTFFDSLTCHLKTGSNQCKVAGINWHDWMTAGAIQWAGVRGAEGKDELVRQRIKGRWQIENRAKGRKSVYWGRSLPTRIKGKSFKGSPKVRVWGRPWQRWLCLLFRLHVSIKPL